MTTDKKTAALPPQIPESEWAESVPAQTIRDGKLLAPSVLDVMWTAPIMRGKVAEGARRFLVNLDLRSRTFIKSECTCEAGRSGRICRHAIAIYFSYFSSMLRAAEEARKLAVAKTLRENAPPSRTSVAPARVAPQVEKHAFAEEHKVRAVAPLVRRPQLDGNAQWISVILPSRDSEHYEAIYNKLRYGGFDLDVRSARWFLRGKHAVLCFLAREWERFRERFSPRMSPAFNEFIQSLRIAKLKTSVYEQGDKFELSVGVETFGVAENELHAALACSRPYAEDKKGRIVLIPSTVSEKLSAVRERLDRSIVQYAGTSVFRRKITRAEMASTETVLEELGVNFEAPEIWRERAGALRDLSRLKKAPVPASLDSRLRIYQQIGSAWLWHLFKNRLGGILADEMGLGKTVETIAFLSAVFAEDASPDLRVLVVAPAGLVENWRRELAKFAQDLPVLVHHGQKRSCEALSKFPRGIVITSYATLRIDNADFLASGTWHTIVADEAQQVKNRRSRNSRALRDIPAGTRFVLTGTPVENSIEDLRTLFDFILPGFMPAPLPAASGSAAERRERDSETVRMLAAPYILRRTKSLVAPELPPRIEQEVWCRFSDTQAKLYDDWKEHSRKEIFELEMSGASDNRLRFAAFSQLLRLRQICTEPRLIDPDFPENESAKLRAFRELLDEAIAGGHRVLVFSQFVSVLNFLKNALDDDGIAYEYIDGNTKNRAAVCARFNENKAIPVCLISLKAGGVGLNLTGADMVVHFDPWWNPAAEAQATDRAHRIGQTRAVTSIKLVVADSVEERVLELQAEKRALIASVFEASDAESAKISLADMKALLDIPSGEKLL